MKVTEITPVSKCNNGKIKLAAYCRVSTNSADQLHSFSAQLRYYMDYVRRHNEYELVDIYADEGITGTVMDKRNDFNRMLIDCEKGKIDRIIVKSISRFARNTEEMLMTLRLLKQLNVSVYFEEQGIDTNKINAEMIVTFPGIAAEQESQAISGNLRWSNKKRMAAGEYISRAPYGYTLQNGKLVINDKEAAVIRRIFEMYLSGIGKQTIANILNEEKVPVRYEAKQWYMGSITYILSNERYIGDALFQKNYTTDSVRKIIVKNKGELPKYYVENTHPAIISREDFDKVQRLMQFKKPKSDRKVKVYPLSSKIVCPDCGATFKRHVIRDTAYWLCNSSAKGIYNCNIIRYRERAIYEAFGVMVNKLIDNRKILISNLISYIEKMNGFKYKTNTEIGNIDMQIADLSEQSYVISKLHTKGLLDDTDYSKQSQEISSQIFELKAQRKNLMLQDDANDTLEDLRYLDELLSELEPMGEFNEELFDNIVTKIDAVDNTKLTFTLIGGLKFTQQITVRERCKTR